MSIRRTHARFRPPLALVALLGAALVGCSKDSRMSLAEFRDLQAAQAAAAAPASQPTLVSRPQLGLAELRPYTLGSGDVLQLDLIGLDSDLGRSQVRARVRGDGRISLPLVGEVSVGGMDLAAAERAVEAAYVPDVVKRLAVYIEVVDPEATTVVVTGAAATPGIVKLRRNERNVLYAVNRAGGIGVSSGRVSIHPMNPARAQRSYDLGDVNDLRDALAAEPLESGDMIYLESANASQVYLTGLVNAPGPITIPRDSNLTVRQALAAVGGVPDALEPKDATLYRRLEDGSEARVKLELAKILGGDEPDIALLPGDVLDVPHTLDTRVRQWAIQNIRIGPFGVTAVYDPVADYRARILRNDSDDEGLFQRAFFNAISTGASNLLTP